MPKVFNQDTCLPIVDDEHDFQSGAMGRTRLHNERFSLKFVHLTSQRIKESLPTVRILYNDIA